MINLMDLWIKSSVKSINGVSNVWKGLVCAFPVLGKWVAWHIGKRDHIQLGEDLWIGGAYYYLLSLELRLHLWGR